MKKGYWVCSTLLCVAVGAGWLFDLMRWHDVQTGFVTHSEIWVRYLFCFIPLVLIVAFSPMATAEYKAMRSEKSTLLTGLCTVACVGFVLCGIYRVVQGVLAMSITDIVLGALCAIAGLWLYKWGVFLAGRAETPTGGVFGGFFMCLYFYATLLQRFLTRPSSLHRIIPVVQVMASMAIVCFIFMLLRGGYLPTEKIKGRGVFIWGQLVFLFAFCLTIPVMVLAVVKQGQPILNVLGLYLPEVLMGLIGVVASYKMFPQKEVDLRKKAGL